MDEYGYTWDAFEVTTEDDYIVSAFRITGTTENGPITPTKESLLIMHGHSQDATSWIEDYKRQPPLLKPDYTPGKPMPLQLADLGYDVWMGNNRGTRYSLGHKTIPATDSKYWNWSWSEMGLYDAPAFID